VYEGPRACAAHTAAQRVGGPKCEAELESYDLADLGDASYAAKCEVHHDESRPQHQNAGPNTHDLQDDPRWWQWMAIEASPAKNDGILS
jgi:hypothetical protein